MKSDRSDIQSLDQDAHKLFNKLHAKLSDIYETDTEPDEALKAIIASIDALHHDYMDI